MVAAVELHCRHVYVPRPMVQKNAVESFFRFWKWDRLLSERCDVTTCHRMGGRPAVTQRYARHNLPTAGITVATRCTDFFWSGARQCNVVFAIF
jgi:hypothetical protein